MHLFHPAAVPGIDIAILAQRHLKFDLIVGIIRLMLAQIVIHAGTTQTGAGQAKAKRLLAGKHPHADRSFQPDAVGVDQGFVLFHLAGKKIDKPLQFVDKMRRHILADTADARIGKGQPRAAEFLEKIKQDLAFAEAIQKHRHRPNIQGMGGQPEQMRAEPRHLGGHGTDVLGPQGHGNSQKPLHRHAVAHIVGHGGDVIEPVGENQVLGVGLVFGQFFKPAMQIPHLGLAIDDGLPVQLKVNPQNSMGSRMLRPHAQRVALALAAGDRTFQCLADRFGHAPSSCLGCGPAGMPFA